MGRGLGDLSTDLRERQDWEVGTLRALDHLLNASTFASPHIPPSLFFSACEWSRKEYFDLGVGTYRPVGSAAMILQVASSLLWVVRVVVLTWPLKLEVPV